jgi:hypothetical protein
VRVSVPAKLKANATPGLLCSKADAICGNTLFREAAAKTVSVVELDVELELDEPQPARTTSMAARRRVATAVTVRGLRFMRPRLLGPRRRLARPAPHGYATAGDRRLYYERRAGSTTGRNASEYRR